MKFKHTHREIKDTEGIGVTRMGDIVEVDREDLIRKLELSPFFEVVKEKPVKKTKQGGD